MDFILKGNGGNSGGSEWIAAEGEIENESAYQLEAYLKENGFSDGHEICLNSPGGDLAGGMRLGDFIRDHGMNTSIGSTVPDGFGHWKKNGGVCASAASFAFIGGNQRHVVEGHLGVHQFYRLSAIAEPKKKMFNAEHLSDDQHMNAKLIEFTINMGVDPRFVSTGGSTVPKKMHYFDEDELIEYRIRWEPKKYEPWKLVPHNGGLVARTTSQDRSEWAELSSVHEGYLRLRLCRDLFRDEDWMEVALKHLTGMNVYKHQVTIHQLEMHYVDGKRVLDINLGDMNLKDVASIKQFPISALDGPRYMLSAFWFDLPTHEAATMMSLALRNPIQA